MKKIFLLVSLFAIYFTSRAQFPSTDSLRAYNNRYVTSNPLTAFQQLRLQTLLNGMIDWIDYAGVGGIGTLGIDTIYALNDSTLRYRKNNTWYNKEYKGVYDSRRKV